METSDTSRTYSCDLSFHSGRNQLGVPVVIITGVARSGKTLVGNLLGSCQHVEHIDEPWLLMMLPILASEGLVSEPLAIQMFQTYVSELSYDRILMRHVNFRPADLSSIWRQKTPQEIVTRLIGLYSRDDVRQYVREKQPTLVLTLTDTLPFCTFFYKAFPDCRIVHVVRDGLDVALAVAEKRWLADEELTKPLHPNLYRAYISKGTTYYLPYWVEIGYEERFLGFSEYTRGLYYWRRLMQMALVLGEYSVQTKSFRVVRFRDVLDRPREEISALIEFLGLIPTDLTEGLLAAISHCEKEVPNESLNNVDRRELDAVRMVYQELDMPTDKIDRLLCGGGL